MEKYLDFIFRTFKFLKKWNLNRIVKLAEIGLFVIYYLLCIKIFKRKQLFIILLSNLTIASQVFCEQVQHP